MREARGASVGHGHLEDTGAVVEGPPSSMVSANARPQDEIGGLLAVEPAAVAPTIHPPAEVEEGSNLRYRTVVETRSRWFHTAQNLRATQVRSEAPARMLRVSLAKPSLLYERGPGYPLAPPTL